MSGTAPDQRPEAGWQSGYAEDCKSLYAGSIPAPASTIFLTLGRPGMRFRSANVRNEGCLYIGISLC